MQMENQKCLEWLREREEEEFGTPEEREEAHMSQLAEEFELKKKD